MSKEGAKEVMYIYNGSDDSSDVEFDADGNVPIPSENSIIVRNGKNWKVVGTSSVAGAGTVSMFPIIQIRLTDQF